MTSLQDFDVTTFESTNLSTLNTTQDRHEEQMGFAWIIITSVILCFMTITTIIGNVFVIAAILLERNLQSVANYLILSLAVADLLVAVLVMPLGAIYEISLEWTFGPILCDMWTSSDVLCCTASILHLLAIAIDRYWAVTQVHYIHSRTSRTIGSMIFFIWLISVIVSLAPLLGWKDPDFETRVNIKKECIVSQDVGYQIFATMATFYVPLVLILLLYWRIFLTARNRLRNRLAQKANVHNYNDKKVTKQPYHAPNAGVVEVSATVRNSKVTKIEAKVLVKSTSDSSDSVSNKNEETAFVTRNDVELREPNQNLNRILPKIKSMSCGNHLHEGKTNFNSEDSESCGTQSQSHQPSPVTRRSSSLQMQKSPFNMLQDTKKNNDVSISGPRFQDQACQTESNKRKKRRTTKKKSNFLNPSLSIKMPVKKVEVDKVAEKLCKKNHISLEARRERKAAKTLAIVTGAFIACWLPFFILALVMPFFKEYQFNRILVSFFLWLGYFNSTLNPIIYTIFSPEFRSAFQRILCGKTNNINHRPRHLQ